MTADNLETCGIVGGHKLWLRAIALALRGPPQQSGCLKIVGGHRPQLS